MGKIADRILGVKQKGIKSLRKPAKRVKLISLAKLKKKLWEQIKAYIRIRDKGVCQACGATGLVGSNAQTSHLIASSICGGYLRYDHRNLYLCCFRCNISLSGNIANLYKNVVDKKGQPFMDKLFEDAQKSIQLDRIFLMNKIEEYGSLSRAPITG